MAGATVEPAMAEQPKKFVLFDFDGVIVDSYEPSFSYVRRYNQWLTDAGHRRLFEGNIHNTMAGLMFGPDERVVSREVGRAVWMVGIDEHGLPVRAGRVARPW